MEESVIEFIKKMLPLALQRNFTKIEQIIQEPEMTYLVQIYQVGKQVRIDIIPKGYNARKNL